MALPTLAGNSANVQLGKERFHKSHHFDFSGGIPMLMGMEKAGIGGDPLVGQKIPSKYPGFPRGEGSDRPPWLAFDQQVLCFEAFYQETVPDAELEMQNIRRCKIYFYLEDGTIQVVEPKSKNGCVPQGTVIRRHRIPLPDQHQFYNVFHFNINQEVVFYARTFKITDCDSFTKNFLTNLGVLLNEPTAAPEHPFRTLRQKSEDSMKPLRQNRDQFQKFLKNDGKILRFRCFWDDTVFGDQQELILLYYLADDTIEVFQVVPNSGRQHVPKFLSRSKLPKRPPVRMKLPGEATDPSVLNPLAPMTQAALVSGEFYRDSDLTIGAEVNIWGRRVVITDCDEFTKDYYRSKYGIEDFSPLQYKDPPPPKPAQTVPPYNGFGSEEDSLNSCQGLLPQRPRKKKFMEEERCGLSRYLLNFLAKMVTTDPVDTERRFIITFYLSDDSISVFEKPQKNSGVLGGKFLERRRVLKPGQELFKSEPFQYLTAQDLYVGASVCLKGVTFQLLDADEHTLSYMEQHEQQFPRANADIILSKVRSFPEDKHSRIREFLALSDPTNTGLVPYESFRGLMMDCGLSEHEVLVLARRFSERQEPEADVGFMLAAAQHFLRVKPFQDFPLLADLFMYHDRQKGGRLSAKEVRTICKAVHLPLPESLREGLLIKFTDGDGIDYHALIAGIDWLKHPAPPVRPEDTLKFELNLRPEADGSALKNIKYSDLLKDVLSFTSIRDPGPAAST
ncbi:EF-hand domain-containing family member C2 isoform X2 [Cyprinodon tularosa]|uniref:EF-hand domain-containing family member C2 isoform X2 n=1 Tax=Cyprinodon tularosa TaxID=77115 RepID=UPI0018E21CBC|nr:EF-hand domain-containing family member C2 isoform X2 [Cyprinodon tularosa]